MPKSSPLIHYLGASTSLCEVTFSIDARRYTYTLRSSPMVEAVDYLARKISLGRALAFAKSHAIMTEKHQ